MPSFRKSQRDRSTSVPNPEPRGYTNGLHFSTIGRSLDGRINGLGKSNGIRSAGAINGGRTNGRINGRVNGRGRTNGRINGKTNGRTNGRINGRINGRTNGRLDGAINGLTNGRQSGLVNGRRSSGITNGLTNGKGAVNGFRLSHQNRKIAYGPKTPASKFLFVLLVIAFIITIPYILVYTIPQPSIKIDGYFLDWNGAHIYQDWPDSVDPDISIAAYAVKSDSQFTYFYIRTQGQMLNGAGNGSDGFYIFLDLDDNPSTGYMVRDIGADIMVNVIGWNGTVMDSGTYAFDNSASHTDFGGFSFLSHTALGFRGSQLELSCGVVMHPESKVAIVARHTGTANDWSDATFRTGGAALDIEEVFDANLTVQSGIEQHLLTVRIAAKGQAATLTGLRLLALGNVTPIQITALHNTRVIASGSLSSLSFDQPIRIGDRSTVELDIRAVAPNGTMGGTVGLTLDESLPITTAEPVSWHIARSQDGARIAYLDEPPSGIVIDGAFGDWAPRVLFLDQLGDVSSSKPLTGSAEDIDISGVKVSSAPDSAFFYMAVNGTMMGGSSVPTSMVRFVRPEAPVSNITNVSEPMYGADFAMIFIDRDLDQSTGFEVGGSEAVITVVGKDNRILSANAYNFSGGQWTLAGPVEAAIDRYQLEIGSAYSLLGLVPGTTYPITFATENWDSAHDDLSIAYTARISAGTRAFGGIILNEICSQNKAQDWVEIYNSGPTPITITGWTLYADGVRVYSFPSITIQPGQFWVSPQNLEFGKATHYQLFDASYTEIDQTTSQAWQEKTWGRTGLPPYDRWTNTKATPGAANPGQVIPEFSDMWAAAAIVPIMLIAIRRISSKGNPPVGEHQDGR